MTAIHFVRKKIQGINDKTDQFFFYAKYISLHKLGVKHGKFVQIEDETWEVCAIICAHTQITPKNTFAQVVSQSSFACRKTQIDVQI